MPLLSSVIYSAITANLLIIAWRYYIAMLHIAYIWMLIFHFELHYFSIGLIYFKESIPFATIIMNICSASMLRCAPHLRHISPGARACRSGAISIYFKVLFQAGRADAEFTAYACIYIKMMRDIYWYLFTIFDSIWNKSSKMLANTPPLPPLRYSQVRVPRGHTALSIGPSHFAHFSTTDGDTVWYDKLAIRRQNIDTPPLP